MFGPATFRGCTAANLTRQPHAPSCSGRPPVTWRSSFHSVRTKLQERQQSCSVLPGRRHNMVLARALGERHERLRRTAVSLGTAALVLLNARLAGGQVSDKIGEFKGSGFIFKDSVETLAVEDPEVQGVTIYITDFKRSISDKLSRDFFNEPSQASVTCASTGPVFVKDRNRIRGSEGKEVFSEKKAFSFSFANKTLRVRRLLDEKHDTLLYVAYSTRNTSAGDDGKVSSGRYKTSVCALPISPEASQAAAVAESKSSGNA